MQSTLRPTEPSGRDLAHSAYFPGHDQHTKLMNIDSFLATHADALRLRAKRTEMIATNIANSDTPGYKARDLAFGDTLADARRTSSLPSLPLSVSSGQHMRTSTLAAGARVMFREPENASLDGNTVEKHLEQARFAENSVRYEASLQFAKRRVDSLIRSLRGE